MFRPADGEKPSFQWREPRDYPLVTDEGRELKQQQPPCPNGCGNDDVEHTKSMNRTQRNSDPSLRYTVQTVVDTFFCRHCMSFFSIKTHFMPGAGHDSDQALAA